MQVGRGLAAHTLGETWPGGAAGADTQGSQGPLNTWERAADRQCTGLWWVCKEQQRGLSGWSG